MAKQKRALVFSEDTLHVKTLCLLLESIHVEVQYETDVYHATRAYKNRPFDLLIADLDMDDEKSEDLLFWVSEQYPLRKIIVTGEHSEDNYEDIDDILQEKAVLGFLTKPVQQTKFEELLNQVEFGLAGRVQRMNVLDLLQALRMSQPQRLVIFKEVSTQKEGVIYLKGSNVIHSELYAPDPESRERTLIESGDLAFYQILRFRNGQFEEKHWKDPEEQTIFMPFDNLAMNASTQIDESHGPLDPFQTAADPSEIRSILLIDQDPMSRILIQKDLFVEGFDCTAFKSIEEGHAFLKGRPTDLVLTDNLELNEQKLGFLYWLNKQYPECPLIFLAHLQSNGSNEEQEEGFSSGGAIQIISKPVNLKTLKAKIYHFASNGFKGYLNQIGVLEFIQLNLSSIDKKKLHIRDLSTGIDAKVYIDRGQFVHAEYQDLSGEEAFFKIVSIENGDFMEDPFYENAGTSLSHIRPHKLMLKSARYIPQPKSKEIHEEIPPLVQTPLKQEETTPAEGVTSLFGDDTDFTFSVNQNQATTDKTGVHFKEEI